MTATTIDAPALDAGVLPGEGWRLIEASDPDLISTWRAAQETFAAEEQGFHERNADFQNSRGIRRRRVLSPFAKALALAEAAVAEALEGMIASGQIVFAGFPAGQLHGAPVAISLDLLGARRPRGSRCTVRGVQFHSLRLFPAEALAAAEPEPVTDPPPTTDQLLEILAGLFLEDQAWETLGPAKLAPVVAQRDRRFRPGNGVWAAATLVDKIKIVKQAAKAKARAQGA